MLRSFQDPNRQYDAPLLIGGATTFTSYLGLLLIPATAVNVPTWCWLLGLPVLIIGALLQFLCKRVLWIRIYQAFMFLMVTLAYSTLLWSLLAHNQGWREQWLTGAMIGVVLVGFLMLNYNYRRKNLQRKNMPHGPIGTLNAKTGVVDLTRSPVPIQSQQDDAQRKIRTISWLSPLITGVIIFLIRILSGPEVRFMLAGVGLIGVMGGMAGTIGFTAYIFSILHWEREHEKQIYINR